MLINDIFENDGMFANSDRAVRQIERDRHPLKDYLTFEDYDMLMDEFADAQSAVKNHAELDAYLEKFESGLESAAIPQVILEIVEEFVHGRHGKYGTEVPRRNQVLLDDLNKAFSQIWMDFKPDRFVRTLVRHMSLACLAAIHAEESDDDLYEEDDDMFAAPRNELGKYIRAGQWASAAIQCIKLGYRNAQVEQNIIPGITRSERSGSVAGGAIWYDVRDWYQQFIAPNDWPELLQYVSSLKAKGPLNSALRHLVNFYADDNQQRTNGLYQLIVDKKAVDALVYFLGWPGNENMRRVPELEPYIMVSPRAAMYYASNVLDARWPDAEPYIATDKVSWSMYAARVLETDNLTKAGRATRDAAQQEALSRLPAGHKKRIAEEDDMFAPSWRITVIQMLRKMLESAALQNKFEIEAHDLEYIQRLIAAFQTGNIDNAKKVWRNFDLDELDDALYLYVVRSHPNIDLYKLLGDEDDYLDEDDDMFASPFRVVHDVMEWQRTAARQFGTRGMRSLRLPNLIVFYVKQEDGAVKGAYYSPQPASDDTNIGTYNKNFNGNIEQYMKKDPHNPLNQLAETDDMFAPSKNEREYRLLDNSSLIKLYRQTAQFARGRPANQKSLGQIAVELNRRGYPEPDTMLKHLYGKVKSAIKETDDDMFSNEPRHFQRLGTSIENYGEGYLEMGRDVQYSQDEAVHEYAGDLIRNGKAMLAAGAAFKKGMQAGLVQWVLVDRDVREDYYNYCREVEDWDPEELIIGHLGLTEEDDMFAPSARTKTEQAIKSVLDGFYDHYQALYDESDPSNSEEWYIKLGEYLSDYDYLRGELARGGIKAFLNGLDMVAISVLETIDSELAIKHKVYLNQLDDQYLPIDEEVGDDMFSNNRVVVNPRTLSNITHQLSRRYHKYAGTSVEPDAAELYHSEAYVLERASNAFLNGLRAGISELTGLEDASSWEDLGELAADFSIDLSALMDKYDTGELNESEDDDEMFSKSTTRLDKLKKMPTDTLIMLWNAIKDDNRPEYAEAHRRQKVKLGLALAGRGIYVSYPMNGTPVIDENESSNSSIYTEDK